MADVSDKKGPGGAGPKTEDSKRKDEPDAPHLTAAADAHLQDTRSGVFGDNTSSSGAANNPGQHGRDGGEINETTNNPAPSENAISGEAADDMEKEGGELHKEGEVKKL